MNANLVMLLVPVVPILLLVIPVLLIASKTEPYVRPVQASVRPVKTQPSVRLVKLPRLPIRFLLVRFNVLIVVLKGIIIIVC